jgi:N-acetylglucosaminyldiphosphoundecaprenol N-acetyl-beta-D-mannosaminyltransferase
VDISILLRAIPASFYGKPAVNFDATVHMLGVRIDNMTQDQALESIERSINGEIAPAHIAFVNADCLNKAARVREYRRKLNTASLVLADGIGVKIAGSMLARPIRQNVNGTDLFPHLCHLLEKKTGRLYLLGARAEVVEALAAKIRTDYPSVVLCGAADGYFHDENAQVNEIAAPRPDVLLVAMGAPVQELFIARNADRLGAKVCIGVGVLFDFYSGRIQRAPRWMRDSGLGMGLSPDAGTRPDVEALSAGKWSLPWSRPGREVWPGRRVLIGEEVRVS